MIITACCDIQNMAEIMLQIGQHSQRQVHWVRTIPPPGHLNRDRCGSHLCEPTCTGLCCSDCPVLESAAFPPSLGAASCPCRAEIRAPLSPQQSQIPALAAGKGSTSIWPPGDRDYRQQESREIGFFLPTYPSATVSHVCKPH